MESTTNTAETLPEKQPEEQGETLTEALQQVFAASSQAAGSLSSGSFARLKAAAFRSSRGRVELVQALTDWSTVSSSASKEDQEVVEGYLHLANGRMDSAESLLARQASTSWGGFYLVQALLLQRKLEAAEKLLTTLAKSAESDQPPLVYARAQVLAKLGQTEEAGELLDGLSEGDRQTADWEFYSGLRHESNGDYREAIQSYRQSVEFDEDFSEGWFRLGFLLDLYGDRGEEDRDEAILAYETCLDIVPLHTNAVINLGLVYEDRERYHDAAKCYESVLRVYPNHGRARLYLGDAIAATKMFYDRDQEKKADRHTQILKIPVTDFELSVRSRNCLQKMNIDSLGDLIMKTEQELLSYKNFGETSLKEIKEMLNQKGLRLGQGLEEKGGEPPMGRNPLEATAPPETLGMPIDDLNLSVRSRRCMERLEVRTVRDLINKTEVELMSAKNFGMTSLNEIKKKLGENGMSLRS